jgi:hypothetical protein
VSATDPERERLRADIARRAEDTPTPVVYVSEPVWTRHGATSTEFAPGLRQCMCGGVWRAGRCTEAEGCR